MFNVNLIAVESPECVVGIAGWAGEDLEQIAGTNLDSSSARAFPIFLAKALLFLVDVRPLKGTAMILITVSTYSKRQLPLASANG